MSTSMPPENRFAECTRKSREFRARMNQAQHEREESARRVPRDRDYATAEPASVGTSATSAVAQALAALSGADGKSDS